MVSETNQAAETFDFIHMIGNCLLHVIVMSCHDLSSLKYLYKGFDFVFRLLLYLYTGLGEFGCVSEFTLVRGDIDGVFITDIDCRCDTVLAVSNKGEVFGWGNSEYGQFDMITQEPQIASPTHLPVNDVCGQVKAVAAAGTKCAVVNGKMLSMCLILLTQCRFDSSTSEVLTVGNFFLKCYV